MAPFNVVETKLITDLNLGEPGFLRQIFWFINYAYLSTDQSVNEFIRIWAENQLRYFYLKENIPLNEQIFKLLNLVHLKTYFELKYQGSLAENDTNILVKSVQDNLILYQKKDFINFEKFIIEFIQIFFENINNYSNECRIIITNDFLLFFLKETQNNFSTNSIIKLQEVLLNLLAHNEVNSNLLNIIAIAIQISIYSGVTSNPEFLKLLEYFNNIINLSEQISDDVKIQVLSTFNISFLTGFFNKYRALIPQDRSLEIIKELIKLAGNISKELISHKSHLFPNIKQVQNFLKIVKEVINFAVDSKHQELKHFIMQILLNISPTLKQIDEAILSGNKILQLNLTELYKIIGELIKLIEQSLLPEN